MTNKRTFIKKRVDINEHHKIIDDKVRFEDLEIDAIISKNHKDALLTINVQVIRLVWIRLFSGKEANPLMKSHHKSPLIFYEPNTYYNGRQWREMFFTLENCK